MVSNQVMLQVSEQEATESDRSMSTLSNYQIMNQIPVTHAHADKTFDVEPLLDVVKNVLDNVLGTTCAQLEQKALDSCFSPPLYTLKELSIKIKEGKHIFFLGGEDKQRKQQFTVKVKVLDKDPVAENAKFSFGLGWEVSQSIQLDPVTKILGGSGNGTSPKDPKKSNLHVPEIPPTSLPEEIHNGENWFKALMVEILPKEEEVSKWMKNGKYSFFYGGGDDKMKQDFVKGSYLLAKKAKISLKVFCMGKSSRGQKDDRNNLSYFWSCIESFHSSRMTETDHVTRKLKKLLSYKKKENGWAVLYAGHKFIGSGNGTAIMKVLKEYDNWQVPRWETFESCFQDYYRMNGEEWFGYMMTNHISNQVSNWFAEGKHIFFYGGTDKMGIEEFTMKVEDLAKSKARENADISREFYPNPHFWVQLFSADKSPSISDNLKQEIKILRSYRDEKLWVMLCEGYELKYSCKDLTLTEMMDLLDLEKYKSTCA